jgi:hypothetical protein
MSNIKLAALAVFCAAGLGITHAANAGGWIDHALRHDGIYHHGGHDHYSISIGLNSGYYGGGYNSGYYRPRSYYYAPSSYYYSAPAYYAYDDSYPGSYYDDAYPVDYGYYEPSSYYGPSSYYNVSYYGGGGGYYGGSYYGGGYRHGWDRNGGHWHDHDSDHDHSHSHDHHGPPHH